jgi:hypothetical protein
MEQERMSHKEYDLKDWGGDSGRESQAAWYEDELTGGKLPVIK